MERKYTVVIRVNSSVCVKECRFPQRHLFIPLSVEIRLIEQSHKIS